MFDSRSCKQKMFDQTKSAVKLKDKEANEIQVDVR